MIVILVVTHLRRTGIGRTLLAVRDNEDNAAAYTVSPARAKVIAFALSGGVAALAVGCSPPASHRSPDYFVPEESLRVLAVSVVGGLSSVTGAVLGTIVIIGIPTVFEGSQRLQLFASGVGMLVLLLYCPGGLISIVQAGRDVLLAFIARRTGWKPSVRTSEASPVQLSSRKRDTGGAGPALTPLVARDVRVQYGGRFVVVARPSRFAPASRRAHRHQRRGQDHVDERDLRVRPFVESVEVFGRRVDRMCVSRAPGHGSRSRMPAASADSVREAVMVALEGSERSLLISLLALPPSRSRSGGSASKPTRSSPTSGWAGTPTTC